MQAQRNLQRQADSGFEIVTAKTLKDAYRKVHRLYGDDAVILGTRTILLRDERNLGQERMVEVTIGVGDAKISRWPLRPSATVNPVFQVPAQPGHVPEEGREILSAAIASELDQIDVLIRDITVRMQEMPRSQMEIPGGSIGKILDRAGTRRETIGRLMERYTAETGGGIEEADRILEWLSRQIPAAGCDWDGFFGCHAFVGNSRSDRQGLVLKINGRFRELGRKTMVMLLFPDNEGDVARLQAAAAEHDFDAAIVRRADQLKICEAQFDQYDVVLVETPDLDSAAMSLDGDIYHWLAGNEGFHRHLVLPLDNDVEGMDSTAEKARHWNCDWIALTRTNRVARRGKLLDILEKVPLPVSLVAESEGGDDRPAIAIAGDLLDGIMESGTENGDMPASGIPLEVAERGV